MLVHIIPHFSQTDFLFFISQPAILTFDNIFGLNPDKCLTHAHTRTQIGMCTHTSTADPWGDVAPISFLPSFNISSP